MSTLDDILDECLAQIATGQATLDECLARYPEHAPQLRRLLAAAAPLQHAPRLKPSASFKARSRAQLIAHIGEHPRRRAAPLPFFQNGLRLAFSFASLVMAFFVVGTVAAQSALPGQALYDWKRTSENVWRTIAPDPFVVDIGLTQRRADELVQMRGSEGEAIALQGYREALGRVSAYTDPTQKDSIAASLANQQLELNRNGLTVPELEALLSNLRMPTIEATLEPTAVVITPSPTDTTSPAPSDTTAPAVTATNPVTVQTGTSVVPTQSTPPASLSTVVSTVIPPVVSTTVPQVATAVASQAGDVGGLIETLVPTLIPDLDVTLHVSLP